MKKRLLTVFLVALCFEMKTLVRAATPAKSSKATQPKAMAGKAAAQSLPRGIVWEEMNCYMAATLQALYCATPFVDFLKENSVLYLNNPLIALLNNIFLELGISGEPITIGDFYNQYFKAKPLLQYQKGLQCDSSEFLQQIVNDLKDRAKCSYCLQCSPCTNRFLTDKLEYKNPYCKTDHKCDCLSDAPQKMFADVNKLQIGNVCLNKCAKCDKINPDVNDDFNYKPFLEIPIVPMNLEKCLDKFFALENVTEREGFKYCWYCKEHKPYQKQCHIKYTDRDKIPRMLVLFLKRFNHDGSEKNTTEIKYELTFQLKKEYFLTPDQIQKEPIYNLVSVVKHSGGVDGGHYIAYGKRDESWYKFDGTTVTPCPEFTGYNSKLRNDGNTTLLFYVLDESSLSLPTAAEPQKVNSNIFDFLSLQLASLMNSAKSIVAATSPSAENE